MKVGPEWQYGFKFEPKSSFTMSTSAYDNTTTGHGRIQGMRCKSFDHQTGMNNTSFVPPLTKLREVEIQIQDTKKSK